MIANLSRRERFIILGAAAVLVIAAGWLFVIEPIRERNAMTAELVPVREEVLSRRRDLVARKGAVATELSSAEERIEKLSGRFLTAAAPAVAASELQNIAK